MSETLQIPGQISSKRIGTPIPSHRTPVGIAVGVFLAAFALYFTALGPSVTRGGDCGELIAASYTLGIAHPSGYPLYMLLGRLFAALLPIGEIAWRYNVFSALCGALAITLVFLSLRRLTRQESPKCSLGASVGGALTLAGTTYFGGQATIAEIYVLNGLLLAGMLYTGIRWHQEEDWRWFYTLALTAGCALTLHLSCVFILPGLFIMTVWFHRDRFKLQAGPIARVALALVLLVTALSTNAYLPLRSQLFPDYAWQKSGRVPIHWPMDWGHPATFQEFKDHVTAKAYKHLLFTPREVNVVGQTITLPGPTRPWNEWPGTIGKWLEFLGLQLLWLILLIPIGAVASWRNRPVAICLLLAVLLNAGQFSYKVNDVANFFFPIYIVMGIWLGLGLCAVVKSIRKLPMKWAWRLRVGGVMLLVVTLAVQWSIFSMYNSHRRSSLVRDIAMAQAELVEQDHLETGKPTYTFLLFNDSLWPFWYVQFVLGRAPTAVTPWAKSFLGDGDERLLVKYVGQLKSRGKVVFSQFHPAVNQNWAFVPLDNAGSLWEVSSRSLPPAAKVVSSNGPDMMVPTGSMLARPPQPSESSHLVSALLPPTPIYGVRDGARTVLRGLTVPVEVKFTYGAEDRHLLMGQGPAHQDAILGHVELLMRSAEADVPGSSYSARPPAPGQKKVQVGDATDGTIKISHQRRPVVVKRGTAPASTLSALVPIEMEELLHPGRYELWVRLLPQGASEETAWQRSQLIEVSGT